MKLLVSLALLMALLFATGMAAPITSGQFVIDGSKPYAYVSFDHIGDRRPAAESEESKGLWLRLVNNCNLPITIMTFDLRLVLRRDWNFAESGEPATTSRNS